METSALKSASKRISVPRRRCGLFLILFILIFVSLLIGADSNTTLTALICLDKGAWHIFWASRVPRTIAILLTASSLSVSGLIMQAIGSNKFISPSTAGTTDAAMLGVLIAYLFMGNQSRGFQMLFAFILALASTLLFMAILSKIKLRDGIYVPLVGIMYGAIIKAVTNALAYQTNAVQNLNQVALGTFNRFTSFDLLYIVLIPLVLSVIYAASFSIAGMGEDFAKGLGLRYKRVVFLGLCIISVSSAASFVTVGSIPFVGLIIPNMVTAFYGDDVKKSVVDVMVFGSVFVLLCDILSRLIIYPYELAVGLTIGIIGGIIFLTMLVRRVRNGK